MWLTYVAGQAIAAAQGAPVSVATVGDLMLNGLAPTPNAFQSLRLYLAMPDVTFGNLETPPTKAGKPTTAKSSRDVAAKRQYVLRADPAWIPLLDGASFDVLSLANNHAMDYGAEGLLDTIAGVSRAGMRVVGAGGNLEEASRPVVLDANGVKVVFLAFLAFRGEGALAACGPASATKAGVNALHGGGNGITDEVRSKLRAAISRARRMANIVLVSYHWGLERHRTPTSYQVALAKATIDAGADGVIGHHPHVLQPYAIYRGKPILYSLGNFTASNHAGPLGETLVFEMRYRDGTLTSLRITPARIRGSFPNRLIGKDAQAGLTRIGDATRDLRRRLGGGN
ncbi:MAG: CapA family protein [Fimbriimonadia bacterium]|jgi:poly-gamma-glutamate synthesis protein (capsule biosynthesis protein)